VFSQFGTKPFYYQLINLGFTRLDLHSILHSAGVNFR